MSWTPINKPELEQIIKVQLEELNSEESTFINRIRCQLQEAKIKRFGKIENVFVVARTKDLIVFYDDVEEGFEVSTVDDSGVISEYGFNQFTLQHVVNQLRASNS
jgi:hypothetical protein